MDVIFALAYKEGVSPVEVSLRKDIPHVGSPEADEILGISKSSRAEMKEEAAQAQPPIVAELKN